MHCFLSMYLVSLWVHLCESHPISLRPHTLRHELGCVSTWWIVSYYRHCVVLLTKWCCFKRCAACWLRPGCGVVSACVVLFQAQCGPVEGIVLSSWGYCPRPTYVCLFMLLVSLSGQRQFHATRPPRSHSHSPLTSALSLRSHAEEWACLCVCVCVCSRDTEGESICVRVIDIHCL